MKETSACLIRWLTIRPRIANRLKKQFGNSGGLNLETRDSETFEVRSGEKKKSEISYLSTAKVIL